jgi:hypothetical protein
VEREWLWAARDDRSRTSRLKMVFVLVVLETPIQIRLGAILRLDDVCACVLLRERMKGRW